jgi:hypothetical protein
MPVFSEHQVTEINAIIAEITKAIKPKSEIGARDKAFLTASLKASGEKKKPQFFKCRREYSDAIVSFFVKEKGVVKNRFHMNNQSAVYILK